MNEQRKQYIRTYAETIEKRDSMTAGESRYAASLILELLAEIESAESLRASRCIHNLFLFDCSTKSLPDAFIGPWQRPEEIPEGWFLLRSSAKQDPRIRSDCFYRVSKGRWETLGSEALKLANQQNWTAIRRIPEVES